MRKKEQKTSLFLIMLAGWVFLIFSCERTSVDVPLSSDEIGLTTHLEMNDGATPFYIYGPRDINFSVSSKKGNIESVQIIYEGTELRSFTGSSGTFHLTPDTSGDDKTSLEMKITVGVEQQKYHETIEYKIQHVKLSAEDFELKEATIDRFVFKMTGKRIENYSYILNYMSKKEIIKDLDNIIIERKFAQFSFPVESNVRVSLVPEGYEHSSTGSYPYVELGIQDMKLGNFRYASTLSHYIDAAHEELYVWSAEELSVFDKDMNEVKHQPMEYISSLLVTPKTGLVVVKPLYKNIVTYSDKTFNTVISNIEPRMRTDILNVNERDQLFNGHNSMIDVYDLRTGELVYSIDFHTSVYDYVISGDKLLVRLGNDGENRVYQLNEKSATLLHSFVKYYSDLTAHPVNHNHIIWDATYNGFEVFDLETYTSLFSSKGQFQSIDPVTGTLLYYDENYGNKNSMYDNHLLDLNYNRIFVFEDASRSTYGGFLQFNNYVIKSDRYIHLLPK